MKNIVLVIILIIAYTIACDAQNKKVKQPISKTKVATGLSVKPNHSENKGPVGLPKEMCSKIKAVIVVGPSEGSMQGYIDEEKKIADFLRAKGATVIELYDTAAKWSKIVSASKGAHIFLYSGHGTTLGPKGCSGGLVLSDGMKSSETIVEELKLHKNALILFHNVCMGAGSSAGDNSDIGINKAFQRVSDYAHPFFQIGAGGYYANNYMGSMNTFLRSFFDRKTIEESYKGSLYSSDIESTQKYMYDQKQNISVASNKWSGFSYRTTIVNGQKKEEKIPSFKNYDVAFVGATNFSVLDFFK